MSALAISERFGGEDPFFIKSRLCRHCLQSEWALEIIHKRNLTSETQISTQEMNEFLSLHITCLKKIIFKPGLLKPIAVEPKNKIQMSSFLVFQVGANYLRLNQYYIQLNEYETTPYLIQLSQNLISDCLLISVYLPFFTDFCMM